MKSVINHLPFILLPLLLLSCSDLGYYGQSVGGHLSIMAKQQSIETLIADPDTAVSLKKELQRVLDIREFAERSLLLPVHDSFTTYADINRNYAVWNVVATPAYALAAKEWCFPIAGCLPYRGYFAQEQAESFASALRTQGLDVHTYGVSAYSTLGWFDDPVLNTFVHYPDWALAGLVFHEMAHQMVYAADDGDFSEAFASAVEAEGVRRWLSARRSGAENSAYRLHKTREDAFFALIAATRQELLACYDGRNGSGVDARQSCKEKTFAGMEKSYQALKRSWGDYAGYDRWFEPGLNNARFVSAQTYRYHVASFMTLLRQANGDLKVFYQSAGALAALPAEERRLAMARLKEASLAATPDTFEPSVRQAERQ